MRVEHSLKSTVVYELGSDEPVGTAVGRYCDGFAITSVGDVINSDIDHNSVATSGLIASTR